MAGLRGQLVVPHQRRHPAGWEERAQSTSCNQRTTAVVLVKDERPEARRNRHHDRRPAEALRTTTEWWRIAANIGESAAAQVRRAVVDRVDAVDQTDQQKGCYNFGETEGNRENKISMLVAAKESYVCKKCAEAVPRIKRNILGVSLLDFNYTFGTVCFGLYVSEYQADHLYLILEPQSEHLTTMYEDKPPIINVCRFQISKELPCINESYR